MAEDIELSFEDLTFQEDKISTVTAHDAKDKANHIDQEQPLDQEPEVCGFTAELPVCTHCVHFRI
jgi:hypothetical protein